MIRLDGTAIYGVTDGGKTYLDKRIDDHNANEMCKVREDRPVSKIYIIATNT